MLTNIYKSILILLFVVISATNLYANKYSFRKYQHVKQFYKSIYEDCINIGIKNHVPPAAIMAIAGLESGYGRGYVAQITGNILSLGAFKGDKELPRLYLPYSKSKKIVIFDKKDIKKYHKNDLVWKKRDKSYKRDYRPNPYAGSNKNLALLKYSNNIRKKAYKRCIDDFATRWISKSSNIKVFAAAKVFLDKEVSKNGIKSLFTKELNNKFIGIIGGHPNSFNYRKAWPKKVKSILNKVGLVELSQKLYINRLNFEDSWRIK